MPEMTISTLRRTRGFMRTTALTVLVAFTTVTVSPSVQAMQQYIGQQKAQSEVDAQERESVGKNLVKARERLRLLADIPTAGGSRKATEEQRRMARAELRAWRAEYRALKAKAESEFDATAELIGRKGLPQVIHERHAQTVAKFRAESAALEQDIAAVIDATSDVSMTEKAQVAFERLDKANLERSEQEFDPKNLPNGALNGDATRTPKASIEAFRSAGLFSNPSARVAQIAGFDISQLPGADNPAYLAATSEIVITPDIQSKANELGLDPIAIYNWVRNNVHWQPTWGAAQSSDNTLSSRRGNAFDIASLTIALLRASSVSARYVHGTIEVPESQFRNWTGGFQSIDAAIDFASAGGIPITAVTSAGRITRVRLEHIWVEAAIDFEPSRGKRNRVADSWVAIDSSFKQINILPGLDVLQISGIDPQQLSQNFLASGLTNESEGWATGFNPTVLQNAHGQARVALESYVDQNLPSATVGDVLGGRRIIVEAFPILPTSLPNRVLVTGARYAQIPASLQQQITFAFAKDSVGDPINPVTFPWAQLNNKQITLSFRPASQSDQAALQALLPEGAITDVSQLPTAIPAYLIRVIPELKIAGSVALSGSAIILGTDVDFSFSPRFVSAGIRAFSYKMPAGSYLSIAVIAGSVDRIRLDLARAELERTRTIIQSGNPTQIGTLTRERLLGDMFYAGLLGYYTQYSTQAYLLGLKQGGHYQLAAGVGSFGYEPKVDYFFGIPRSMKSGGAAMNIPIVNVIGMDSPSAERRRAFTVQLGVLSSMLEHVVPEHLLKSANNSGEAMSAVKALSKASAAGQRIYQITASNQSQVLPLIHHDQSTMDEIRVALLNGMTVITHVAPLAVHGWSGAGYVILDSQTGSGAWKIGGGANGSFYDFCNSEGAKHLFCSLYVWVYDCVNPAAGDLTCAVGYLVAALLAAPLGIIGATIAGIATALELYAQFDSLWYSDQSNVALMGVALFVTAGLILSLAFSPGVIAAIALSLLILFLNAALTTFIKPSQNNED